MNKKRYIIVVTAVILLVAAVTTIIAVRSQSLCLRLTDTETGTVYAQIPVQDGDTFSVTFKHSVNKTDVSEIYQVRGNEIWLTGCTYYSFGAGVAEELDPSWTLHYGDNGEMILSDIELKMTDLTYVVGTVYDHMLTIGQTDMNLRELCGRNSSVRFEII